MNWHTCVSQLLNILWLMRHKTPPGRNSHHENAMYWRRGWVYRCRWLTKLILQEFPCPVFFGIFIGGKQGFIQLLFPPAGSKAGREELVFLCLAPSSLLLFTSPSPNIAWPSRRFRNPNQCPQAATIFSPTRALESIVQKEKTLCKKRK